MAYQLNLDADIGASLLGIAHGQSERLCRLLADAREPASGHHRTRRCLKRLRALLTLAQPVLGRRGSRRLDRSLAKLGRALSHARDRTVVLELLMKLADEETDGTIQKAAAKLIRRLQPADSGRTNGHDVWTDDGATGRELLLRKAQRIGRQIAKASFDNLALVQMVQSATVEYRTGQKVFAAAYRTGGAESFHDLRKRVQRHIRHLQLLSAIWPEEMQVRIALAKFIAGQLGHDHDLALVRRAAAAGMTTSEAAALDRLCRDHQRAIRSTLKPQLARLYAEQPKAFARRMAAYSDASSPAGSRQPVSAATAARGLS